MDDFESEMIEKHKIKHLTPHEAEEFIKERRGTPFHISFNVDALDPKYMSSTSSQV